MTDNKERAKNAANHLTELYILGAIQDILEGGSGNRIDCGQRIIRICEKERQKILMSYDREIARISK